ncbi:MAG TPA: outer membrane beta-barrel protein [Blastocatellia bacterium]|nr:outer membrane beta-barrel protein [Blastocatellia bacterium]
MRRIIVAIVFIVLAQGLALGQSKSERKAWVYGFGGIGGGSDFNSDAVIHVGGGGEGYFGNGVGIGAEIGYLASTRNTGNGIALASVNGSYHFNRSGKARPFLTGGASIAGAGFTAGGGNFGGGVNYWMNNRFGLRFEVRDHIFSSDTTHTVVFRVGFSFH